MNKSITIYQIRWKNATKTQMQDDKYFGSVAEAVAAAENALDEMKLVEQKRKDPFKPSYQFVGNLPSYEILTREIEVEIFQK